MKKIRLLTSLACLSALSMGLVPTIASCSCSNGKYSVELVSKKKEREYNQKTNGCSYTFKVENETIAKATKVKLINLKVEDAETKSVAGLVKISYDSAGGIRVLINTNTLVSQWPNASKISFDLLFTNKTTGETSTFTDFNLTYNPLILVPNFETVDWSIIIDKSNQYYDGKITIEEFVKSFGDEDGYSYTSIDQYLGLERTITLNTKKHKVRVIGINHDTLTTPTKTTNTALFTFELANLLCYNNGDYLLSKWNNSLDRIPFDQSTLYNCLNNPTDDVSWYQGNDPYTTKSPYYQLKTLWGEYAIKKLNKTTVKYESGSWTPVSYSGYLFPLSYYELTGTTESGASIQEGSQYAYYKNNTSSAAKVKTSINGDAWSYNLVSNTTQTEYIALSWCCNRDGGFFSSDVTDVNAVSFAFCI